MTSRTEAVLPIPGTPEMSKKIAKSGLFTKSLRLPLVFDCFLQKLEDYCFLCFSAWNDIWQTIFLKFF
jgi:hypothetical protein